MGAVEDVLKQVPLFSKLSNRDLKSLAGSMKERVFDAGTVITEPGKSGVGFFVIDDGTVSVVAGEQVRATLKRGDSFGEIALIDGGPRTAKIVADTEVRCYGLTAWDFRPFVQAHPDVAWSLLQTMAQRLRDAEARSVL